MRFFESRTIFLALGLVAVSAVQADHNSVWGEGWASMPNDIHDTRIDTMDDETDSLIDFVRMGSGAESDNPLRGKGLATDSGTAGGREQGPGGRS